MSSITNGYAADLDVATRRHLARLQSEARKKRVTAPKGNVLTRLAGLLAGEEKTRVGTLSFASAERRTTPPPSKILIIVDHLPLFDQQAGCQRIKTIIEILVHNGASVLLGCALDRQRQPGILASQDGFRHYQQSMRDIGVASTAQGRAEIDRMIQREGKDITHAMISFPHVGSEYLPMVQAHVPWAKTIYDMVDFHALRIERQGQLTKDVGLQKEATRLASIELDLIDLADLTFAISTAESDIIKAYRPNASVVVVPTIFDMRDRKGPAPKERRDIFFLGGFWHEPNEDAVCWFCAEVWPILRQNHPELNFIIAGSNMGPSVTSLNKVPGVQVIGHVADLPSLFDRFRVFVAPLRYGAGLKGKVGQSMSLGLPVVGTDVAFEGFPRGENTSFVVANSPAEFADGIGILLQDDDAWLGYQTSAFEAVRDHFSRAAVSSLIQRVFDQTAA